MIAVHKQLISHMSDPWTSDSIIRAGLGATSLLTCKILSFICVRRQAMDDETADMFKKELISRIGAVGGVSDRTHRGWLGFIRQLFDRIDCGVHETEQWQTILWLNKGRDAWCFACLIFLIAYFVGIVYCACYLRSEYCNSIYIIYKLCIFVEQNDFFLYFAWYCIKSYFKLLSGQKFCHFVFVLWFI